MARSPFLCISIYLLLHFDILFLLRLAPGSRRPFFPLRFLFGLLFVYSSSLLSYLRSSFFLLPANILTSTTRMFRLLICVIKYFQLFRVGKYMGILNRIVLGRRLYLPTRWCSFTTGVSSMYISNATLVNLESR
ncbi:hypothetical protein BDQ17DRAFT_1382714 [Cyathus striatus]|nr:hypothetical protein BDQ17DRAFT_1382714 [Cyathus striatus]